MSLRFFHILFVVTAVFLSLFFGLWCRQQSAGAAYVVAAVLSYIVAGFLTVYAVLVSRKLKKLAKVGA